MAQDHHEETEAKTRKQAIMFLVGFLLVVALLVFFWEDPTKNGDDNASIEQKGSIGSSASRGEDGRTQREVRKSKEEAQADMLRRRMALEEQLASKRQSEEETQAEDSSQQEWEKARKEAAGTQGEEVEDQELSSDDHEWLSYVADPTAPVVVGDFRIGTGLLGHKRLVGKVLNNSGEKLTDAKLAIYFVNSKNVPLVTKEINPLVVSGGVFGDRINPLRDGNIRRFGVKVDDVSPLWSGQVAVKVISYRLGEGEMIYSAQ
ncbi:MAG: hypothetical protein HQL52_04115 [Magnetococcales bacterium]|nr:hypothetical protein [Magnetococcales bacterium]